MLKYFAFAMLFAFGLENSLFASCCSSASTGGVSRLLSHERALVELSMSTRYVFGRFDSDASFSLGHINHLPHLTFEQELQIVTRLLSFFEPFVRLPVRIQASDIRTGANLSDMSIGARNPIFRENILPFWPALSLIESVRLPTGAAYKNDHALKAEDITSTGSPLFTLGFLLEKEINRITYGLGYSLSAELHQVKGAWMLDSFIHTPLVNVGFFTHADGFLSFSVSEAIHYLSGLGAERHKLTVGAGYALTLHSHIKLNSQLGADVPITYLGKNNNNEFFFRLGLRLGVF